MPILKAETSVYPENLLNGFSTTPSDRRWWAIYTKPRREKTLARQMLREEVPFYLPLIPRTNFIRGRPVQSHLPVYAGYVFLFGSDEERMCVQATEHIFRLLPVEDQRQLRHDLTQLSELIEANAPLTVEERLLPGQRVRVKAGVLKGLEGTILMRRGEHRLFVAMNLLQQGVSMAIDDFMVEPID